MSEYQYYEFQAIDRPLDQAAGLASDFVARGITSTSFTNHCEWGDLKADPRDLVARCRVPWGSETLSWPCSERAGRAMR